MPVRDDVSVAPVWARSPYTTNSHVLAPQVDTTRPMVRTFAPQKLVFASNTTPTTFFPVIYRDVLLVLMAPFVHSLAPRLGKGGMAKMSTALAIGINVGLVFVVPGAATVAQGLTR